MAQIYEKYKFPKLHDEREYTQMMIGLLPNGIIWGVERLQYALQWFDTIWSSDEKIDTASALDEYQDVTTGDWSGSTLGLLLSCFGSELARIESDAWDVLNGTDPGVTTDTYLYDWERNLGTLNDLSGTNPTIEERQIAAHSKLFGEFVTTTEQAFIDYASTLGYTITIDQVVEEYLPRLIGQARMGYERIGDLGGYSIMEITVADGDGTMEFFESKMNKFKPAHAYIIYVDARP